MVKIAIVVNDSWAAYNFRFNLGLFLKKAGYEVFFVCPKDKYSELIEQEFTFIDINLNKKGTNPLEDVKTIFNYYKLYKKYKFEIVLHFSTKPNIYGTFAASMAGIYSINNIAGLGTLFIKQNIVTKLVKYLYKYSQNKATKIFFQNRDDFEMFVQENLVKKESCDILPGSGVDINKFKPISKEENNNFKFLLVSRMLWAKGIKEFVDAAKSIKCEHKNVEFQLLGQLDLESPTAISKNQMNEWIEEGNIIYLGSSDDVRVEISKADCIVLPSFYREGTPRVLLESASMGKPIITTDNVGCRDVVEDKVNGYLCKSQNTADLIEKMKIMLNLSIKSRNKMGEEGRKKIIKEFDEKIVLNKYLDAIKEIVK